MKEAKCTFENRFDSELVKYYIRSVFVKEATLIPQTETQLGKREQYLKAVQPLLQGAVNGDVQMSRKLGRVMFEAVANIRGDRDAAHLIFKQIVELPLQDVKTLMVSYVALEKKVIELDAMIKKKKEEKQKPPI